MPPPETVAVAGIDWATEPENRAIVELVSETACIRVGRICYPAADDEVVEACGDQSLRAIAVDTPFGWPLGSRQFITGWSAEGVGDVTVPSSKEFRFRTTDRLVREELEKTPLSVSADRIALSALSWASLATKHALRRQFEIVDRPVVGPSIVEVYPGATLAALFPKGKTFQTDAYKKDPAVRGRMMDVLAERFGLRCDDKERAVCAGSGNRSDAIDALIAALTALIHLNRIPGMRSRKPTAAEANDARIEGWIYFPESQEH